MKLLKKLFIAILMLSACALLLECMVLFNAYRAGSSIVDPLIHDYSSVSNYSKAEGSVKIPSNVGNSVYDPQKLISMLKLEIFDLSKQCLEIQNVMSEDDIHLKLLINRGYKTDSPEVIKKLKEQSARNIDIENNRGKIIRLENMLMKIEQEINEAEEIMTPRDINRDLERELYIWQQNTHNGQEHLLQLCPLYPFVQRNDM